MGRVLIIGAGSAGSVVVKKCLMQPDVFSDIHVAARTKQTLSTISDACNGKITTHQCDADYTDQLITLLTQIKPELVINMALPYQDLTIMDACLDQGVHYLDTANYEPKDEAKFCYQWQWDYHERFEKAGLMALLGCGFDPGVTNIFCAYAAQEIFDDIETIDIVDCNAGDHGHPFATNFNPEINIREITQRGKYWKQGTWIETEPLSEKKEIFFPEVGYKSAYLMYHEEIESLARHIPHVKQIRFWMTFSESYLTHLNVLQNVGMTRIDTVNYHGKEIVPLQFLKEVLPNPSELGENYTGKTCIGCIVTGTINNQRETKMIYNVCEHQHAYHDCKAQAVGYTTGVPAMIGAKLILNKTWFQPGVVNVEQCNPVPFMNELNQHGLPWTVTEYNHEFK
ncbi:saccharopine dehydrogenase [Candidatus Marinamargulisbacteria bacterium SCGC AG-414-C22]|nr:saccharopine dehydrogenase [Candidatus Marinamargulisbacteria bacterium SCGC AG-414-C22]RAP31924.1 saccharopine dehydrogenase [Candidatus Marinamargulisbacteria bacterium SCGC AG-414-C22]